MKTPGSRENVAWSVNAFSWRDASRLAEELHIPLVVAMVMAGRGLSDATAAHEFLSCKALLPDPFLFAGMDGAVGAIANAIDKGQKIVVHGDYDADGITATALLQVALAELGADVDWYLPSRFEEGYGLSRQAVEAVVAQGAAILVTVDCGVNYPDEVAFAKRLGLDVVVVDHHQPGPRLPECHLIHHAYGAYPHGELCGVGLALKLVHALHVRRAHARHDALPPGLTTALDLVALGTIADLAPLHQENRYYVSEGIKLINIGQRLGLRALAEIAGCAGNVDSGTIAFRLAPRLNAAGRLADPSPPLRLLLSHDDDEARALAADLHELNGARQDLERQMFEEALRLVSSLPALPKAIVLAEEQWHEGVVGIVASRIAERYQRPALLLSVREGIAKGSGRSIPAYNLFEALASCHDLLTVYGGHAQAVGLTLAADRVDDLRQALQRHADAVLRPESLIPTYHADAVATAEELNADTALALAALEPFGTGNPRPRLLLVDATLEDATPTRNGLHLRCRLRSGGVSTAAIGFGMGKRTDIVESQGSPRPVGAQLRVDAWQGTIRPQLMLECVGTGDLSEPTNVGCGPECPLDVSVEAAALRAGSAGQDHCPGKACSPDWPAGTRDLRGKAGRWSHLAQVLAAQERSLLLTVSCPALLGQLRSRLPLEAFAKNGFACVSRYCATAATSRLRCGPVVLAEWEAAGDVMDALADRAHAVVLDPPFRPRHLELLARLGEQGTIIHLLYGEEERATTARFLRYQLHPRFAMVCVYRAMQAGESDHGRLFRRAASIAWEEAKIVLTTSELEQAHGILSTLGLEQAPLERARLEARNNTAYREAEAEYEECAALCLTL
jgi:single-stranded-DNA-specific exonuclease